MHASAPAISVEIVPGLGHMGMVLDKLALERIVAAAKTMVSGGQ